MKHKIITLIYSILYTIRALSYLPPSKRLIYKKIPQNLNINILGTGPSLKNCIVKLDPENSNNINFALNDFGATEYYVKLKPQFYVVADPAYWTVKEKCNGRDFELREKLFDNMNRLTTWKMKLFLPWKAYKESSITQRINNSNIIICPYNNTNFYPSYSDYYNFILKKNLGVVPVGNVLGAAIYLSINMGYRKISIYGAEHSWTKDLRVNEKNEVCTIKRHFFDNTEELIPWRKSNTEIFKMSEILRSLCQHFFGYEYLNWYAEKNGSKIINYTKDSFIDSFDRGEG